MDFLKDLCLDMVNHPDCSGSEAVKIAYLLFNQESEDYNSRIEPWEDDCCWMEEPF